MKRENIIFCFVLNVCTNRYSKKGFSYTEVKVVSIATVTVNNGFVCLDYDIEDIGYKTTRKRVESILKFTDSKKSEDRILVKSIVEVVAVFSRSRDQTLFIPKRESFKEETKVLHKKRSKTIRKRKVVNTPNQQSLF